MVKGGGKNVKKVENVDVFVITVVRVPVGYTLHGLCKFFLMLF